MPKLRRRDHSQGSEDSTQAVVDVVFEEDGVHYTCHLTKLKDHKNVVVGDIRQVKWRDGRWYPAKILKLKQPDCSHQATLIRDTDEINEGTCGLLPTNSQASEQIVENLGFLDNIVSPVPANYTPELTSGNVRLHNMCMSNATNKSGDEGEAAVVPSATIRNRIMPIQDHSDSRVASEDGDSSNTSETSFTGSDKLYTPSGSDIESSESESSCTLLNDGGQKIAIVPKENNDINTASTGIIFCESDEVNLDTVDIAGDHSVSRSFSVTTSTVHRSTKTDDGRRKYDKVHYCMYCKLPQKKISRHVIRKHKDEEWVQEVLKEPSGSRFRKIKLEQIRNQGDWLNNDKVLTSGTGKFISWKSPSLEVDKSRYLSCEYCKGSFLGSTLWKHIQGCRLKTDKLTSKGRRVKGMASMLMGTPTIVGEGLRENILLHMNCDRVSLALKNDRLILAFGEKLYHKLGHDKDQHPYIAQKMRELGRLLIVLRDVNKKIKCLTDVISPTEFNSAVAAVQVVTGYNVTTAKYQVPSLALKLGHSLNKCAALVKYEGLTTSNDSLVTKADQFKSLMDSNWSSEISSHALSTLNTRKWNKPLLLPITEDIVKFTKFLKEKSDDCKTILKTNPNTRTWYQLAKVVLSQIILFNRRRSGETSKVLLDTYDHCIGNEPSKHHGDIVQSLTELEKQLVHSLFRFEVRGKKGKKVPILLTGELKSTIDTLKELRSAAGVEPHNPYVFAKPYFNSTAHIRGHDCLRQLAVECGLKHPHAFTSTKLRKHIATISQILNLKGNELDMLASFLGHDINVHRQYYRLPEDTLQVPKIGKILMNMQKGNIQEYAGKSLDEIQVTTEEAVLSDWSDDGNSEESEEDEDDLTIMKTHLAKPKTVCNENKKRRKETPAKEQNAATNFASDTSSDTLGHSSSSKEMRKPMKTKIRINKQSNCKGDNIPKRKCRKVSYWSDAEIAAVQKHLGKYLILNKLPGKTECEECIAKESEVFKNRQWQHLKFFIKNALARKRMSSERAKN